MSAPIQSTCGLWAELSDLPEPCSDYESQLGTTLLDECLQAASDVLFQLSGRQFSGSCSDCVRPTARYVSYGDPMWWNQELYGGTSSFWLAPGLINGLLWNGTCSCNKTNRTGCTLISEITLGGYPVTQIDKVLVDGVELVNGTDYRIDDFRWLVRLPDSDGNPQGWPCCQNMLLPSTEPDTFEVTFTYGVPPPVLGKMAAAKLACELAKSTDPDLVGQCQLPQRVTSITRQGVSMVLLDPMTFIKDGKTGIYIVDMFLQSVNPKGLTARAEVISPDIRRRVRRAGT